ncbi:MAG: hypothetical protein NC086_00645 [Alistipes sp.]|nr:hypothetical protein [Alistipes sp.]
MSNLKKILAVNLKYQFRGPFFAALAVVLLTPVFYNVSALSRLASARPLEMFFLWTGGVLFTPICLLEQDKNIRDCVRVRKTDYYMVCLFRILYSAAALCVMEGLFVVYMKICQCDVTIWHFIGGTASALFFGCLGFFAAGVTGNVIAGYMVQMVLFVMNYGLKDKMGVFYLFSMSFGSFYEKWWQLFGSVVLVWGAFLVMRVRER